MEVISLDIYTIGHSTHTKEEFINMLHFANIEVLVDVRAFPGSRKFPQFTKEHMEVWLPLARIEYVHLVSLAGRRTKSPLIQDIVNKGWKNQSFHNYADYTLTEEFQNGIDELEKIAFQKKVAYCCSERHPSRCHRLLISNWLAASGWSVNHIIDGSKGKINIVPHKLGEWGAMPIIEADDTVVYPEL